MNAGQEYQTGGTLLLLATLALGCLANVTNGNTAVATEETSNPRLELNSQHPENNRQGLQSNQRATVLWPRPLYTTDNKIVKADTPGKSKEGDGQENKRWIDPDMYKKWIDPDMYKKWIQNIHYENKKKFDKPITPMTKSVPSNLQESLMLNSLQPGAPQFMRNNGRLSKNWINQNIAELQKKDNQKDSMVQQQFQSSGKVKTPYIPISAHYQISSPDKNNNNNYQQEPKTLGASSSQMALAKREMKLDKLKAKEHQKVPQSANYVSKTCLFEMSSANAVYRCVAFLSTPTDWDSKSRLETPFVPDWNPTSNPPANTVHGKSTLKMKRWVDPILFGLKRADNTRKLVEESCGSPIGEPTYWSCVRETVSNK